MKNKLLTLIIAVIPLLGFTQNPFEDIGIKVEVLTLSNGEYQEFFPNDTLRRVGSVMFNAITEKIEYFVSEEQLLSESTAEPYIVSRWFSRDPLAAKYPSMSPYNFVSNSPIVMVDPDGADNIIYLIALPTPKGGMQIAMDYQKVAKEANAMYKQLGVETRVVVFEGAKFDPTMMDDTDAPAYVGHPFSLNGILHDLPSSTNSYTGSRYDPLDLSPGQTITVSTLASDEYMHKLNVDSREKAMAFGIIHGSSHLAGVAHLIKNPDYIKNKTIDSYALDGMIVAGPIGKGEKQLEDYFDPKKQPLTVSGHNERFGTNPARDNYYMNVALEQLKWSNGGLPHIHKRPTNGKTVDETTKETEKQKQPSKTKM